VDHVGGPLQAARRAGQGLFDEIEAGWLVPPVQSRIDRFADEVTGASENADVALDAVRVAPALFGGDGPRRYLVLFTTTAEARGLGGFIGNYGELTAVDGDVELTRSGRMERDFRPPPDQPPYTISGPPDYLARYGELNPGIFVQDTSFSPDFPTVGTVWTELYPQVPGGGPIDGVIMVDPEGLAGLLRFTGPIQLTGLAEPLTADNAAEFLLRDQYLLFQDGTERIDFLDEATRVTFEALTSGDIPGPATVTEILGPLVRGGHLAVYSVHDDEAALYRRTEIDGKFPEGRIDLGSLVGRNAGNSKIDIFSQRSFEQDTLVDPDAGRVETTVTIELVNEAPPDGLPEAVLNNALPGRPPGTNTTTLSWYSTLELD
ncbi:MAG: DUF4012 domain-containing protein, partial [Actinomycetota bacterium]